MKPKLLLLVCTVFALQAGFLSKELAQAKPKANPAVQPFSIAINVLSRPGDKTPNIVQVGQQIVINIALTNTSTHSIDAPSGWLGALDLIYKVVIHDEKGNIVAWHAPDDEAFVVTKPDTLDPGKTKTEQMRIDSFYDLKPGVYELQIKRYIDIENRGDTEPKYDPKKGEVMSNKITVTVIPAAPTTSN